MMTPEEFHAKMLEIFHIPEGRIYHPDSEAAHCAADDLMCNLLSEMGYTAGIQVFIDAEKWYA